jgi:hypothetical protein
MLLNLLCFHLLSPGNGFQRRTFPLLSVPELSSCLCYQLRILIVHKDSHSPTNSLYSIALHATDSLNSVSVKWYTLGEDHRENTSSNNDFTLTRWLLPNSGSNIISYLRSFCLAMTVVSWLVSRFLPFNGHICHSLIVCCCIKLALTILNRTVKFMFNI